MSEKPQQSTEEPLDSTSFIHQLITELKELEPIDTKYKSRLEEVLNETRTILESLIDLHRLKNRKEKNIKEIGTNILIRIIEILGVQLYKSSNADPKKAAEQISEERFSIPQNYITIKQKLSKAFDNMRKLFIKHSHGIINAIQLKESLLNLLSEVSNAKNNIHDSYNFTEKPDFQIFNKNTNKIGETLSHAENLLLTTGAQEIFLQSVPKELYEEFSEHFKDSNDLVLSQLRNSKESGINLILNIIQGSILYYLSIKLNAPISSNIFPSEQEIQQVKQAINNRLEHIPEAFDENKIQEITEEVVNFILNDTILEQYKSKKLKDFYKKWLTENVEYYTQQIIDSLTKGTITISQQNNITHVFTTKEYIKEIQQHNISPNYSDIDKIRDFEENQTSKIFATKRQQFLTNMSSQDYKNNAQILTQNFSITNILIILAELEEFIISDENLKESKIKAKTVLTQITNEIIENLSKHTPERLHLILMYIGYGFEGELLAKTINIENFEISKLIDDIFKNIINEMSEKEKKRYEQFLRNNSSNDQILENLLKNELSYDKDGKTITILNSEKSINDISIKYKQITGLEPICVQYLTKFIEYKSPILEYYKRATNNKTYKTHFLELYKFYIQHNSQLEKEIPYLQNFSKIMDVLRFVSNTEEQDNNLTLDLLKILSEVHTEAIIEEKKEIIDYIKYNSIKDKTFSIDSHVWIDMIQITATLTPNIINDNLLETISSFKAYLLDNEQDTNTQHIVFPSLSSLEDIKEWRSFFKASEDFHDDTEDSENDLRLTHNLMTNLAQHFAPEINIPSIQTIINR